MNEDALNVVKKVILPTNAQVPELVEVDLEEDQSLNLAQNQVLLEQEVQTLIKHTAQNQDQEIDYMGCYNNDK